MLSILKNSLKSNNVLRGGVLTGFISRSDWLVSGELDSFVSKLPFLSATLMAENKSTLNITSQNKFTIILTLLSFKINLKKKSSRNTIRVSNSLDPDQYRHSVFD